MASNVIPYGVHDYKTIIDDKSLYVDKTRYIEELEGLSRYTVFMRPRRFGKTLMTSVLSYYYDVKHEADFDYLFKNTYIASHKTDEANKYSILKFSFAGIDTNVDKVESDFYSNVRSTVEYFISRYIPGTQLSESATSANSVLRDLITKYSALTDRQIYLLIDEYDQFANGVLSEDISLFLNMTSQGGFLRSFYEVLKEYAGITIGRIYITGVTPITLDCLTSGFNIATNISNEPELNEMVGFTDDELRDILSRFNLKYEDHIDTLTKYYNGYKFSESTVKTVYNSIMVLNYLRHYLKSNSPPRDLVDTTFSSDLKKITGMFDLYNNEDDKKEILEAIVAKEPIISGFKSKFEKDIISNKTDFVSMLYYLGFLTIMQEHAGRIIFTTPNYTVEDTYFKFYLDYIELKENIKIDISEVQDFIDDLIFTAKYDRMKRFLEKQLRALSNRDFIKFDEKYVKLLLFVSLRMHSYYTVKSELEVEGGSYIDLALLPNFINKLDNYYIIEFKYIKSEDAGNRALISSKREEAIDQLNKYSSSEELSKVPNLRKLAVVAVKDEVTIEEI